jgi:hypothetical protein
VIKASVEPNLRKPLDKIKSGEFSSGYKGFHMTVFTKKELQTQINNIDTRVALLKLPTVTIEEGERIRAELQKLNAARSELLEKMKVAPE